MTPQQASDTIRTMWETKVQSIRSACHLGDQVDRFEYKAQHLHAVILSRSSNISGQSRDGNRHLTYSASDLSMSVLGKPGAHGDLAMSIAQDFLENVGLDIGVHYASRIDILKVAQQAQSIIDESVRPIFAKVMTGDRTSDIDLDVIRIIGASGHLDDSIAYKFYTENVPSKNWRRQALEVWPMFSGLIGRMKILSDAVDAGSGTTEILADIIGVKPKFISRFQKVILNLNSMSAIGFVREISSLPPDLIPKFQEDQFKALSDLVDICLPLKSISEISMNNILKDSKGNWVKFHHDASMASSEKRMPEGATEAEVDILVKSLATLTAIAKKNEMLAAAMMSAVLKENGFTGNVYDAKNWLSVSINPSINGRSSLITAINDLIDMINLGASEFIIGLAANAGSSRSYEYVDDAAIAMAKDFMSKSTISRKNLTSSIEILRKYKIKSESVRSKNNELTSSNLVDSSPRSNQKLHEMSMLGLLYPAKKYRWSKWFEPVQAPNGLWICDLNSDRLLYYEGSSGFDPSGSRGMNHCCACYNKMNVDKCIPQDGKRHILSVRKVINGKYFRMGTAEINGFRIDRGNHQDLEKSVFLYSANNTNPPPEGQEALNWFLGAASRGEINFTYDPSDTDDIKFYDRVEQICGYSWQDSDELNRVKEIWDSCMDSDFRKMTPKQIQEIPEIKAITKTINPSHQSTKSLISKMPKLTMSP